MLPAYAARDDQNDVITGKIKKELFELITSKLRALPDVVSSLYGRKKSCKLAFTQPEFGPFAL